MPAYADTLPETKPAEPHMITNLSTVKKSQTSAEARCRESVVVSGMSGRFPESNSVEEFAQNLFTGVDMVTDDARRWTPGAHGLPRRSGKLPDLAHFDSAFFSVSPRQAHAMDPQLRLLLELTYEAIVDAGLNPSELRGRRVGVYVGVSSSESEEAWTLDPANVSGYALTGCCRAMFPNRISYTFDFKGPSFAIDTACSSSMVAFQTAWSAVSEGEVEAAVVGGTNLTLKPQNSMQFNALNMLAADGKCKSFDASGNGYVRSEAAVVILLQRAPEARRVYAHIVHARANTDGHKGEGVTFPSGAVQRDLLQEVYNHAGVSPLDVSYVEAHGTGTKAGDPQEVGALAEVFCCGRSSPLMIGSVKSNMGHSEPASGLCSIVKVLLAMQQKELPGNLHFKSPNPEIPALLDGRIKVVSENTPWAGGFAAVNSFGFGGANVHVLLRSPGGPIKSTATSPKPVLIPSTHRISPASSSNGVMSEDCRFANGNDISFADATDCSFANGTDEKITEDPAMDVSLSNDVPRLVVAAGRTEEAVTTLLQGVKKIATPALCGLLDKLSGMPANSHPARGYTLINSGKDMVQASQMSPSQRPLWLVFSGMGSQWTGCGRTLLRLPSFAASIRKCHAALLPLGLDLIQIVTSEDPAMMSSTAASFSTIAAMQVALVDLLWSVGVHEVAGMVGHSVGELGCAYVDGALTAEQTVLAAYWRGRAVQEATLPPGAMAAVGLSAAEASSYCKDGVVVACHNASDSVTLSGPKEAIEAVLEKLTAEDIFCRAVQSEGVAFHHPTLKAAAPRLLEELTKLIPCPRQRSSRWVSSSVPEAGLAAPGVNIASPVYLVNNLLSPVLFAEALEKVPADAVAVEVSPHGLLQAILRRSLPQGVPIPLIRKEAKCPLTHFLEALGKMYVSGVSVDVGALYPKLTTPVPPSTPSLASLIRWDHNQEWDVARFSTSPAGSEYEVKVDLDSEEHRYLEGHTIDGRVIFPATGYLVLAWQALCRLKGTQWEDTPVTFSNVTLHQATVLSSSSNTTSSTTTTLTVRILLVKGEFEVVVSDSVAVSGNIHLGVSQSGETRSLMDFMTSPVKDGDRTLLQKDVYKELRLRGYHYGGLFQGITQADLKGTHGVLMWQDNWVSFLDTMLQFSLIGVKYRALMLPTRIRKISVDPSTLLRDIKHEDSKRTVPIHHNSRVGATACRGVVIQGLKATLAPRRPTQDNPLLENYQFLPLQLTENHQISSQLTPDTSLGILLDLALENTLGYKLKIVESASRAPTVGSSIDTSVAVTVMNLLNSKPQLKVDYVLYTPDKLGEEEQEFLTSSGVVVKADFTSTMSPPPHLLILHHHEDEITGKLSDSAFIMTDAEDVGETLRGAGYLEIASVPTGMKLLRKSRPKMPFTTLEVSGADAQFSWVAALKEKVLGPSEDNVWLLSSREPESGILGLVNCLRREPGGEKIRCVFAPEGKIVIESDLLNRDLAINVRKNSVWGTYRHLPLSQLAPRPSQDALLNVATRGDLSSLTWFQMGLQELSYSDQDKLVCDVYYAPLNFRDVMLATGKLPPDALPGDLAMKECILGLEFAGMSRGKRFMGLVPAGGLATSVKADPLLAWLVPASWSLKDAATVPVVYATAYYALVVRGGLRAGESVLIHAGSGGVGQAAISIALARSCTVYTTVGSPQKKAFLQERFPQLKDENFANSRDGTFEYAVLERTGGDGVDVVLNSLAGDLLQASVRCLKQHGRFLEIGKADLSNNTALGMAIFLKNVTFHGILLDSLFDGSPEERQRINDLVSEGLRTGVVRPLPATLFTRECAEDAFRYMATGKHIGKVVLEIKPESSAAPDTTLVPAVPRVNTHAHMVYVITGGLGGLGLELAGWLISRGARKLVLTSRRGITTGYQALCVRRWRESGATVRVLTQDASTTASAASLLQMAAEDGPVGGIFHLAMVLKDSLLENQSEETFRLVNHVKGNGAVALDTASRACCPDLHLWVTFSSIACGKGNAGQTNYGWANSVCERVVEARVRDGLPGVAIQWGGVGDVGVLADTLGDVEVAGTKPQSVRSVLECLDRLLLSASPVVSSVCLATKKSSKSDGSGGGSLVKSIANVLGMKDVSKAPLDVTLGDLGLDSLMSVEVKQTLEREADLVLTAAQVRELTLRVLQDMDKKGGSLAQKTSEGSEDMSAKPAMKEVSEVPQVSPQPWLKLPLLPEGRVMVLREGGNHVPLFLAAPIQGTAAPLAEVTQGLDRPVYGLQYPSDVPHYSITEMAQTLVQELQRLHPSGDFVIGGYSFGTAVALEMTRLLEKKNRIPTSIVLLDGSQSYVTDIVEGYKSRIGSTPPTHESLMNNRKLAKRDDKEQIEILIVFAMQFTSVESTTLKKTLLGLESWEERVNKVAELVTESRTAVGVSSHQNERQQAVKAAEMLYQRLIAGSIHKPEGRVQRPTLLVRARHNLQAATLGHDYGLSKIVEGTLKIEEVAGTHESFVQGASGHQVTSFIQTFLQEPSHTTSHH